MFAGVNAHIAPHFAVVHAFIVRNRGRFQVETFAGGCFNGVAPDDVPVFVDAGDINVLIEGASLRQRGEQAERGEGEETEKTIHVDCCGEVSGQYLVKELDCFVRG